MPQDFTFQFNNMLLRNGKMSFVMSSSHDINWQNALIFSLFIWVCVNMWPVWVCVSSQDYRRVIENLPEDDRPAFFGLPANIARSSQRIVSSQVHPHTAVCLFTQAHVLTLPAAHSSLACIQMKNEKKINSNCLSEVLGQHVSLEQLQCALALIP